MGPRRTETGWCQYYKRNLYTFASIFTHTNTYTYTHTRLGDMCKPTSTTATGTHARTNCVYWVNNRGTNNWNLAAGLVHARLRCIRSQLASLTVSAWLSLCVYRRRCAWSNPLAATVCTRPTRSRGAGKITARKRQHQRRARFRRALPACFFFFLLGLLLHKSLAMLHSEWEREKECERESDLMGRCRWVGVGERRPMPWLDRFR